MSENQPSPAKGQIHPKFDFEAQLKNMITGTINAGKRFAMAGSFHESDYEDDGYDQDDEEPVDQDWKNTGKFKGETFDVSVSTYGDPKDQMLFITRTPAKPKWEENDKRTAYIIEQNGTVTVSDDYFDTTTDEKYPDFMPSAHGRRDEVGLPPEEWAYLAEAMESLEADVKRAA